MVQTDISQLSAECTEWRQILRNYRQDFHDYEKALQEICRKTLEKKQLLDVEHFQNQFDIQLNNIHNLKQQIKTHEKRVQSETAEGENVKEETFARHENLLGEFLSLESTLQDIRVEFQGFINRISC
jgi:DNA repair exonuclease SbcCD ATPase subunit